jgi:hypothetical protein
MMATTIEVRKTDGTAAYTPVLGDDGDVENLQFRCELDCRNWNRDHPEDPWVLHVDSQPVATDAVSEKIVAAAQAKAAAKAAPA